jgi:UDP-glucose 4-epimerase
MRFEGMKICVTGGMGFVGSHTAKSLRAMGAYVVVVDQRYTGIPESFYDEFIRSDYADDATLRHLNDIGIQGFVHCAGSSLVGPSMTQPSDYYNNNVKKNIEFLDFLASSWSGIKPWIVFSSSAATYGNPVSVPIKEDDLQKPINPYGETKLIMEHMLRDYSAAYGIRSFSLRYFNACGADYWGQEWGPEKGDTHLIPRLFEMDPFTLFGTDYATEDGTCVRDYIHVSDLALAHATSCQALSEGAATDYFNLGTNTGYSNQQVIDKYHEIAGPKQILKQGRREGDPDELVADGTKFQERFNWKPYFSDLNTIVNDTMKWYKKSEILKD